MNKYLTITIVACLAVSACQTTKNIGHGTKRVIQTVNGHNRRISLRQRIVELQQLVPSERDRVIGCAALFAVKYKDNAALASEIASAAVTSCSEQLNTYADTEYQIIRLTRQLYRYSGDDFSDERAAEERRKELAEQARGRAIQAVIESRTTQSPQTAQPAASPL